MTATLTLPLLTNPQQRKELNIRFDIPRIIWNIVLREIIKRYDAKKAHPSCKEADLLYKVDKNDPEAKKLYQKAELDTGFYFRNAKQYGKENGIERFVADVTKKLKIHERIDSRVRNKIAERVWNTFKRHKRNTHFKCKNKDPLYSVEGKDMKSPLKFDFENKTVIWNVTEKIKSQKLVLPLHPQYLKDELAKKVLSSGRKFSYVRLKRNKVNGEWRYFVQLIYSGDPIGKGNHKKGTGKIAFDMGVKDITVVTEDESDVDNQYCEKLENLIKFNKNIRLIQRKIDRQRRAKNPHCYNKDGTIKKGPKKWGKSNRQKRLENKLSELYRKQAEYRKFIHGELSNNLRSKGDYIAFENCSYKGWQSKFGKSIGHTGPASLINKLKEKFNNNYFEFDTKKTKFSQTCPRCFDIKKKTLSERIHKCQKCGLEVPRNLASAVLAYNLKENYEIDKESSKKMIETYLAKRGEAHPKQPCKILS
jgi:transposase